MRLIYSFITIVLHPFLFFYLKFRVIKKKEHKTRYIEKLGYPSEKKLNNLIWFHVASLGEIKSIKAILANLQKKNINLLITSGTLSSYEYFENNVKNSKTLHQFSPFDSPLIVRRFIKFWKPKVAIFVESELWPNLIFETSKTCDLVLLNCRISKKTFYRWKIFHNFFKKIIKQFKAITCQNKETQKYLEYFGVKNINYFGNLKFTDDKLSTKSNLTIINNKFNWASMSVHFEEIKLIINIHKNLQNFIKDLTTYIIPRHLNKIDEIIKIIENKDIPLLQTSKNSIINKFNGIVLVDQFGVAEEIFKKVKCVFMGGSFVNHGGQNPLEPAKYGCKIFHGKNIYNFNEIYDELKNQKISKTVTNENELFNEIKQLFNESNFANQNYDFSKLSHRILNDNLNFLNEYIN